MGRRVIEAGPHAQAASWPLQVQRMARVLGSDMCKHARCRHVMQGGLGRSTEHL